MLGYTICQHTTVTRAAGSRVRTSLQFLSAFHLVTAAVNQKLNWPKAHLPERHLVLTCVFDKEEKSVILLSNLFQWLIMSIVKMYVLCIFEMS